MTELNARIDEKFLRQNHLYAFDEITRIDGPLLGVSPPVNWENPFDYHGYFVYSEQHFTLYFKPKDHNATYVMKCKKNDSFFINWKTKELITDRASFHCYEFHD